MQILSEVAKSSVPSPLYLHRCITDTKSRTVLCNSFTKAVFSVFLFMFTARSCLAWLSSFARSDLNLKRPVAGMESTKLEQEVWKLPTLSDADMAVALVMPSLLRLIKMFSKLCEKSTRLSLSYEEDRPLSVLSARASELPPRSLFVELFSVLLPRELSLGLAFWSFWLFLLVLSEFSTAVLDSELESRAVESFGFVVDMLGLVLFRDAIELGAA